MKKIFKILWIIYPVYFKNWLFWEFLSVYEDGKDDPQENYCQMLIWKYEN